MKDTPKADAAIFELSAQIFLNKLHVWAQKGLVATEGIVQTAADECVTEAKIFVQTFKTRYLDEKK
jgi:hypothetical protein